MRPLRRGPDLLLVALLIVVAVTGAMTDRAPGAGATGTTITVVGDSLTVGTSGLAGALEAAGWADARVDAKSGRYIRASGATANSGILTIRAMRAEGWDTPDWVVALGTNDTPNFTSAAATEAYLQRIVDEIGAGHRIAFVALALPTMAAPAARFNTVVRGWAAADATRFAVVDWDQQALSNPAWYAPDQVHYNASGYRARTAAVVAGVAGWLRTTPLTPPGSQPERQPAVVTVSGRADGMRVVENQRVVDTRIGTGLPARLAAGRSTPVPLATLTAVPTGAVAVVANLTTAEAGAAGFLAAGACATIGTTSVQNFGRADVVASLAVVELAADGSFCVLSSAATDLLIDVVGWVAAGGAPLTATAAVRVHDSRPSTPELVHTLTLPAPAGAVGGLVNVTVDTAGAAGHLSATPCGATVTGSNLNFSKGETVSNLALVPLGIDRRICVTASVAVDVIVDVVGYVGGGDDASDISSVAAARVLDTRNAIGGWTGRLTAEQPVDVPLSLPTGTTAALVQITATGSLDAGFVVAYDCSAGRSGTSNVNLVTTVDRSNLAFVALDGGDLCFASSGRTHLVVDVMALAGT